MMKSDSCKTAESRAKSGACLDQTLAYSIWHVFRIEDIVLHTLILNDTQVLESGGWQKKTGAEIITTGNELAGQQHVLHMGLIPEELVYLDLKL
ncbi:MAG: hypothetical protein MJ188_11755 [Treponema sp.]|nr:hypothetical protein [Treponema sp.]